MVGDSEFRNWSRFVSTKPAMGIDLFPCFDLLVIGCFIAISFSKFILNPGIALDLPRSSAYLPTQIASSTVLTIDRNGLFFFEGKMLNENNLIEAFSSFLNNLSDDAREAITLLIKADRALPTEVLFETLDTAKEAGFESVHLATEYPVANPPE